MASQAPESAAASIQRLASRPIRKLLRICEHAKIYLQNDINIDDLGIGPLADVGKFKDIDDELQPIWLFGLRNKALIVRDPELGELLGLLTGIMGAVYFSMHLERFNRLRARQVVEIIFLREGAPSLEELCRRFLDYNAD
jgi:hypothetical protein